MSAIRERLALWCVLTAFGLAIGIAGYAGAPRSSSSIPIRSSATSQDPSANAPHISSVRGPTRPVADTAEPARNLFQSFRDPFIDGNLASERVHRAERGVEASS